MDMRSKMDVARDYFSVQIGRVKKESEDLRVKYSLANKGALLDSIKIPSDYGKSSAPLSSTGANALSPAVYDNSMFDFHGGGGNSFKMSNDANRSQHRASSASLVRSSNDRGLNSSQKRPMSSSATGSREKLAPDTETELNNLVTKIHLKTQKKGTWSDNELRKLLN